MAYKRQPAIFCSRRGTQLALSTGASILRAAMVKQSLFPSAILVIRDLAGLAGQIGRGREVKGVERPYTHSSWSPASRAQPPMDAMIPGVSSRPPDAALAAVRSAANCRRLVESGTHYSRDCCAHSRNPPFGAPTTNDRAQTLILFWSYATRAKPIRRGCHKSMAPTSDGARPGRPVIAYQVAGQKLSECAGR